MARCTRVFVSRKLLRPEYKQLDLFDDFKEINFYEGSTSYEPASQPEIIFFNCSVDSSAECTPRADARGI